jgi:hypothetical protein
MIVMLLELVARAHEVCALNALPILNPRLVVWDDMRP